MSFLVGMVALAMVTLAILNVSGDFQIFAEPTDYADNESVAVESTSVVTEECSYGSGEVKQRSLQAEPELPSPLSAQVVESTTTETDERSTNPHQHAEGSQGDSSPEMEGEVHQEVE